MASSSQTAIPQAEPASALEKKDVLSAAVSASAARSTRAKSQSTADVIPSTNGTNAEESTAVQKVIDPNNPAPWKHPDELPYIRREDWSQDLMLEYLIQKSFSIPPRDNASNPFVDILPKEAPPVTIPRKYRVPLMFLAKFQWESLRLVLNASDPKTEWHEFKFDIIHITRLCQHLFNQAKEAKERGGPKGLDKMWRSPMFDRVLTRFYHHWFISRDWFLKHFYEEFEEEEYQNDILRNDWARWALKGHKGFRLTKNEIQNGITAEQFMRGLGRNADGVWTWTTDPTISESSITTAAISNEPASPPASENMDTITNVTPANNSVEVKREHMEAAAVNLPKQSSYHAGEAVTSIPTPPPTSNPSSPPIAQAAAASKNVPNFTPPTQVTSAPAAPFPDTSDTSSRPPPQTVTPIAMAVPSISAGVSIIAPVPATGTVSKALNSESNTVSDIAQSAHLSIHASQNATATAVSDKAAPETDKVTEPTTNPLQPAAMSKENITISNNQVPADTSTQLAGTKRAHDDVDSPITASPSRKKNQAHARRSLAEAYRYGQLTSAKLSGPQKSSTKTVKSSVADAATEGSTEGSSASEKLSIKLKRATTSATVPPLKKRKRASGRPDSNVDSSISVALSKRSRAHSSKKRSQRSSAVRILSGALVTSGTDDEESASVAKSDGPSKLPASAMSSLTSNHLTSSTPNVSSAAFLIPANPKQTILSYLNGSAPQRLAASPIIPAVNPFDSTTEVSKKAVDNPTTNGGIANNVPAPKSLTPKPLTHQPSIAKEATPTASGRSQIVSKASESIIAHGLLDVSRQSPAPKDRSEGAVPFTTSVAQSQTAATVLDEKSPPKSKSPDNAALPINGATHESQGKVAASLAGPGTNDDAPAAKSVQTTQRSTVASPILPTYTSIASLIGKALPESQVNAGNEKNKEERMVVDVEAELKSPSNLSRDRSLAAEQSVGLLMAQDTRAKSLHTILLLRDLLEFLCSRTQTSTSPHSPSEPDLHNLLDSRTRRMILNEEEAITIDHRLDVLAHASVALAKVLYPYRGAELERRIIALDKRLQQQFDMVWTREQQLAAAQQLRARTLPDKEVQTSSLAISRGVQTLAEADTTYGSSSSTSSVYVTQAVQTSGVPEDRSVLDSGTQTEDIQPLPPLTSTERKSTPLSTDVTMVDLPTNAPVGKHDSEMDKSAPTSSVSRRSEPVAKIMMAIMRNMADLFECSTREDGITSPKSEKGKEREVDTSDMRMQVFDGFGDSPIVSTIMNEFKTMKDEMRITDWVREEMRSMSSLHATQVNSLQEEVKKGKQELEETKRRYQAQIDNLNVALQMAKKGKGRLEMLDDEERAQAAELHELKRRISSLESRNRYSGTGGDSISAASRGSPAPPTPTDLVPARWGSHSLSHLPGQDSRNAPSPSPVAYGREHPSKPGTPVSGAGPLYGRSVDRADSEEAVPLPAKSQRKKNVFYFPRGPV